MDRYRVPPGSDVDLDKFDPDDYGKWDGEKQEGKQRLDELRDKLDQLQEVLYAEHKHKVMLVIQAMDTAGKDSTIRGVFSGINPQGVDVTGFKGPTPEELDHDYLWRIHKHTPGRGEIAVFNRSHYEDVLVVRVHQLVPEEVWRPRYQQINDFERMLVEEGTTIRKFFLCISKDEQRQRLQDRIDDPKKHWKFNPEDLKERALWGDYMQAYAEMLSQTSTQDAPWYIVPSNHNWYRNLVVASVVVEALESLNMKYPPPAADIEKYKVE